MVAFTQEFDAWGLRTRLAATIGGTADFVNAWTYDNLGRSTRLNQCGVQGGSAVAEKRIDFAWDAAGHWSTLARLRGPGRRARERSPDRLIAGRSLLLPHPRLALR